MDPFDQYSIPDYKPSWNDEASHNLVENMAVGADGNIWMTCKWGSREPCGKYCEYLHKIISLLDVQYFES